MQVSVGPFPVHPLDQALVLMIPSALTSSASHGPSGNELSVAIHIMRSVIDT